MTGGFRGSDGICGWEMGAKDDPLGRAWAWFINPRPKFGGSQAGRGDKAG